jgi:hypothetical protein
MSESEKMDSYD